MPAPAPPAPVAVPDILCLGAAHWDIIGRSGRPMPPGADQPGRIARSPGGVALNVAFALVRRGFRPALLAAVGADPEGGALLAACAAAGVATDWVCRPPGLPTDAYLAIEGPEGLVAAVADAATLEAAAEAILAPLADGRLGSAGAPWAGPVVIDGNLTGAVLAAVAASALFAAADLRLVPASPGKADRLRPLLAHPRATFYLNLAEAGVLAGRPLADAAQAAGALVALGARRVLVTDGARAAAEAVAGGGPVLTALPPAVPVRRVTGAGDAFVAGHLAADRSGAARHEALTAALRAAADHVTGANG
jgi:sugar/nucleoside kinase (ribokinase family)